MPFDFEQADAVEISKAVRSGEISAREICGKFLEQINQKNQTLNCFTAILSERAFARAKTLDEAVARGEDPGPLTGVPFAVKNLFDIAGITTIAGSKINRENPSAAEDATAVKRLEKAGAILVGALNMDEYAYGFVTENSHYGATPNPHDITRISGGSSGGSAASVAAGLVPFSLGSDTNGSIRVPASLCGILGLKPTYGRLSRAGVVLFASSLDHIGPMARTVRDIAAIYDSLQGEDRRDPVCTKRPPEPTLTQLERGIKGVKIGVLEGYFAEAWEPAILEGVAKVAEALNATQRLTIPEAHRAKAAAYIITACEGSNLHLSNLRSRPQDFDPATRDRFLAGALIPAVWYNQAQRFRRWYQQQAREIFRKVDILLAPTTPCVAPKMGRETLRVGGEDLLVRPNLGLYTQPLSFIGLPVLSVPVKGSGLPVGVQIIGAPHGEGLILRVARELERSGIVKAAELP